MGNCLVTKLKGIVNNDNLFKVGELRFRKYAVESPSADSGYLYLGENRMSLTHNEEGCTFNIETAQVSNNDGIIHVFPKYDIQEIVTAGLNVSIALMNSVSDIVKNAPYLVKLGVDAKDDFDLSEFKDATCKGVLQNISMSQLVSKKYGSIENLAGFTALKSFSVGNKTDNVIGNIGVAFGDSILLNTLYITAMTLSGSFANLAEIQVGKGRTSGSLVIYCENTTGTITVDGTTPLSKNTYTITFDSSLPNGYSIS